MKNHAGKKAAVRVFITSISPRASPIMRTVRDRQYLHLL